MTNKTPPYPGTKQELCVPGPLRISTKQELCTSRNPYLDSGEELQIKARNLPHWHQEGKYQFITFHLHDSLPADALRELETKRKQWQALHTGPLTPAQKLEYLRLFSRQTEMWLDNGHGSCLLRDPAIAEIVAGALRYHHPLRYTLIAYVVMPNHVHVLIRLHDSENLSVICKSWKSYTATRINKTLRRRGQLWHHESWDRMIRNRAHYLTVLDYIALNIRTAGIKWHLPGTPGAQSREHKAPAL